MIITEVDVRPIDKPKTILVAYVSITLDAQLTLDSIRLYKKDSGYFVSYPVDSTFKEEVWRQFFFPTTQEFREQIEKNVIMEYEKIIVKGLKRIGQVV